MDWREDYQPGSFRGAGFVTEGHERTGGRRAVRFEYPGRDAPSSEDMGRRARQERLDLHVWGTDYFARRDALVEALEAEGPGLLVHPWLGSMQVVVVDYSLSETTDEGGIARFSVQFGESGLDMPDSREADANAQAAAAADDAADGAIDSFAGRFSIAGLPGFVETAAATVVDGLGDLAGKIVSGLGGNGSALTDFADALDFLDDLPARMRNPVSLGGALVDMVQATVAVAGTTRSALSACNRLIAFDEVEAPLFATTARLAQTANGDALLHLVRHAASAEMVRAIANADFSSRDEAVAIRSAAVATFDALALAAADAGEDGRASDFDSLRRAMVADIAQRVPGLPALQSYVVRATQPAIVIAMQLYGAARAAAMADDIVARNGIANPAMVPGGTELKVLVDA